MTLNLPHVLQMISSMATKAVMIEMAELFEQRTGYKVEIVALGGVEALKRVQTGEVIDLVVLTAAAIRQLTEQSHLRQGSDVALANSGIYVAVKAGASHPDIESEDSVRSAVLKARSVGYSTGPSGVYLEQVFARWGVLGQLRERLVLAPPGVPVASFVAHGSAELGFQQLSELMSVAGIEVVGPLPESLQLITTFSGAVAASSQKVELAQEALKFFASQASLESAWLVAKDRSDEKAIQIPP